MTNGAAHAQAIPATKTAVNEWRERFGATPPVGWRLRTDYEERWVRFHSLPNLKRYPETSDEWGIVLKRAEKAAKLAVGDITSANVFASSCSAETSANHVKVFQKSKLRLQSAFEWTDQLEAKEDRLTWRTFWTRTTNTDQFRDIMQYVADDEISDVIWVSPADGRVFAPYDGGFDLILSGSSEIGRAREKFHDWLSPLAHGL